MEISPNSNSNSNSNFTPTPALIIRPPPPFPAPPRSVDLSALEFILGLIAVISIPALIYTFFFAIKCPADPFRRSHRQRQNSSDNPPEIPEPPPPPPPASSRLKYSKETHGKELGGECPVCLSAFADGEEVEKLTACDHAFHGACIDPWLASHANCPVCRASVAVTVNKDKRPTGAGGGSNGNNSNNRGLSRSRQDDFHQGLPDAANLV